MTRRLLGAAFLCLVVIGCQAAAPPETLVPVKGKVTVKGKPLAAGTIVFHPDRDKGNVTKQEPRGTISEDGTYELESTEDVGAPAGAYKVTIFAMKNEGSTKPPTWLAAQKYTDVKTSGLTADVPPGGNPALHFDITPP